MIEGQYTPHGSPSKLQSAADPNDGRVGTCRLSPTRGHSPDAHMSHFYTSCRRSVTLVANSPLQTTCSVRLPYGEVQYVDHPQSHRQL